MKTFEELGLSKKFVELLSELGIKTPSEIQEKAIPLVVTGRDVIGGSATGSGKTLAFASGIIENLNPNGKVQALILTPTRELAEQVAFAIRRFSKNKNLNVLSVYGGVAIEPQIRKLGKADVIVGTPGRILDHMRRDTLRLDAIGFLVLDEVDRMFDMGFQKDVEMIIGECPENRQTMLFSATLSPEIDYLAQKYTKNAAEISVEAHVDTSKLKQIYYDVPDGKKFSLFVHMLREENAGLVMVFCGTRQNVDFVTTNLNNLGIEAKAIHGGMAQKKRTHVLNEFHGKGVKVLVCTDVAARGLDIRGVTHVYNYDLPKTSADYIHRIGRTARAGEKGKAISILCSRDYENFSNIIRDSKIKIEEVVLPQFERVNIKVCQTSRKGGRGFGREKSFGRGRDNRQGQGTSRGRRDSRGEKSFGRGERGRRSFESIGGRGRDSGRRTNEDRKPRRGREENQKFGRGRDDRQRGKRNFSQGRKTGRRNF